MVFLRRSRKTEGYTANAAFNPNGMDFSRYGTIIFQIRYLAT